MSVFIFLSRVGHNLLHIAISRIRIALFCNVFSRNHVTVVAQHSNICYYVFVDTLHEHEFLSTSQAAEMLGVTRITVFRWIKNDTLQAKKIGRNYLIPISEVIKRVDSVLTNNQKESIKKLVDKTVQDYGETIRMLGRE